MEKKIFALYRIQWTEYERGWGCRPDGETYHCSREDADKYIKDYWAKMPDGPAPYEYSAPGTPTLVEVTEELYNKVMKIVKPPDPPEVAIKRTFDNIKGSK